MTLITLKGKLGKYQFNPNGYAINGGTGKVYKGKVIASYAPALHVEQSVSIKVLYRELTDNVNNIIRAEDAANIQVQHPNLLIMYEFIENPEERIYHTISEWLEGETLEHYLQRKKEMPGAFSLEEKKQIIFGLFDGVGYLHSLNPPVFHRDIKPSNIMLTKNGNIKIMDYGIAKVFNSKKNTNIGVTLGSLEYAPPEQINGSHDSINATSDIYALGNTIFEIFYGRPPFKGTQFELMQQQMKTSVVVGDEVSEPYRTLIIKATQKVQENRFQNIAEMRDYLNNPNNLKSPGLKFRLTFSWIKTIFWFFLLLAISAIIAINIHMVISMNNSKDNVNPEARRLMEQGDSIFSRDKEKACEFYQKAYDIQAFKEVQKRLIEACRN